MTVAPVTIEDLAAEIGVPADQIRDDTQDMPGYLYLWDIHEDVYDALRDAYFAKLVAVEAPGRCRHPRPLPHRLTAFGGVRASRAHAAGRPDPRTRPT